MTGISYFLALATASFPRHDIILARPASLPALYLSLSPSVSPTVSSSLHYDALPDGGVHGVRIRVEDCGSKRRTVVYIKAFLFSSCFLFILSSSIRSVQPRDRAFCEYSLSSPLPLVCQISSRTFVSSATPKNTPFNKYVGLWLYNTIQPLDPDHEKM
jgi:hypothetical protein